MLNCFKTTVLAVNVPICGFPHARHFPKFTRVSLYFVKGILLPKGEGEGEGRTANGGVESG